MSTSPGHPVDRQAAEFMRKTFALPLVITMGVFLLPAASTAQEIAQEVCDNATEQSVLNQCADQDYRRADAALNESYKEIEGRLEGQDAVKAKLLAAQRAWLTFRDAQCDFENVNEEGGSIHAMGQALCKAYLTQGRTEQLDIMRSCEEGQTGCPVPPAE